MIHLGILDKPEADRRDDPYSRDEEEITPVSQKS